MGTGNAAKGVARSVMPRAAYPQNGSSSGAVLDFWRDCSRFLMRSLVSDAVVGTPSQIKGAVDG